MASLLRRVAHQRELVLVPPRPPPPRPAPALLLVRDRFVVRDLVKMGRGSWDILERWWWWGADFPHHPQRQSSIDVMSLLPGLAPSAILLVCSPPLSEARQLRVDVPPVYYDRMTASRGARARARSLMTDGGQGITCMYVCL